MADGLEENGGGTAVDTSSGGMGNGQATGTGQVSENFDIKSAVDDIGSDLGFKVEAKAPVAEKTAAPAPAPAAPAVEQTPEAKAAAEAAAAAAPPKAGDITAAPKTWKPEEAALWAQIPDAAKAAIARREEDMFRGLESYKGAAQFGNSVNQVVAPYNDILRAQGINPVQLIGNLMNAQYKLATGTPAQKQAMFAELAKDYGIDLGTVNAPARSDALIDPEVLQLREKIQQLESGQTSLQQARQQEVRAAKQSEVNVFASDPANVHFNDVADDIVALLQADKALTLKAAYEKAIWLNPVTRAKEIARQDAEKQTKAAREAQEKADQVRASKAANVQVQPKAGAATLPLGTMDETMEETLRGIKNRS